MNTHSAPKGSRSVARIMIGVPTLGTVRIEWANAMQAVVIPCNWGNSYQTPINFAVDDAQNLICHEALSKGFEWILFIEDDVVVPPNLFLILNKYMQEKKWPVVSGLYRLKGSAPEPLMYRGRGNGAFTKFKLGEKVQVDGVPTGCLLIHSAILLELQKQVEKYDLRVNGGKLHLSRIFHTPRSVFTDVGTATYRKLIGTSDLNFCDQVLQLDILKKAGFPKVAKERYPFLVDTKINCGHIDRETGQVY